MARDSYTLMLVPDAADAQIHRVQLKKRKLYLGALALMFTTGVVLVVVVHYTFLLGRNVESAGLVGENERMRAEVAALAKKVDQAESELYAARRLDERLRAMTDLNDEDRALSMGVRPDESIAIGETSNPFTSVLRQLGLDRRTPDLLRRAKEESAQLAQIVDDLSRRGALAVGVPRSWPIKGWVTSRFGRRRDPTTREPAMHLGIDIAAPEGAEVRAPATGRVLFAGVFAPFGRMVVIDHGRDVVTHYGHLNRILVSAGDRVVPNQAVGLVGNTGRSFGPHVHYEVRVAGIPVDPERFIVD